jgi:hypothetical protein
VFGSPPLAFAVGGFKGGACFCLGQAFGGLTRLGGIGGSALLGLAALGQFGAQARFGFLGGLLRRQALGSGTCRLLLGQRQRSLFSLPCALCFAPAAACHHGNQQAHCDQGNGGGGPQKLGVVHR